jgi:hypothetical protein
MEIKMKRVMCEEVTHDLLVSEPLEWKHLDIGMAGIFGDDKMVKLVLSDGQLEIEGYVRLDELLPYLRMVKIERDRREYKRETSEFIDLKVYAFSGCELQSLRVSSVAVIRRRPGEGDGLYILFRAKKNDSTPLRIAVLMVDLKNKLYYLNCREDG